MGERTMSEGLIQKKAFAAPIVDRLAVRVVVDFALRALPAQGDASVRRHRARRPGPAPPDDVAGLRVGPVAAPRIRPRRRQGAIHAGFRLHAGDRAAQCRPARHRSRQDRRPDPQPRPPRSFRRPHRFPDPAPFAHARRPVLLQRRRGGLPREVPRQSERPDLVGLGRPHDADGAIRDAGVLPRAARSLAMPSPPASSSAIRSSR